MSIQKLIWCDQCGKKFGNDVEAKQHEKENCFPYEQRDRVLFSYGLLGNFKGELTDLSKPVGPGEVRSVTIHSDTRLEEPDGQAVTGYDVYVSISNIQKKI